MKDDGSAYHDLKFDVKNDVASIPYSSGTTGLPKGVMLTHFNIVACFEMLRWVMSFGASSLNIQWPKENKFAQASHLAYSGWYRKNTLFQCIQTPFPNTDAQCS